MDQDRRHQQREVQRIDEILAINEFDFPFPRFNTLPKEGAVILKLQGFRVVDIVGLNPNLARIGDLALLIAHIRVYTRVQIWLRTKDGA
jgi:hypothetical protein